MSLVHAADAKMDMEEESSDLSLDHLSSKTSGIYGVPEEAPRIGDEYQAQLPQFIEECDRSQLVRKLYNVETFKMPDSLMGLPISILWIHAEARDVRQHSVSFISNEGNTCTREDPIVSINESETAFADGHFVGIKNEKEIAEASDFQVGSDEMDVDIVLSERKETELETRRRVSCPCPDSVGETWTDSEQESFLLGLYIFGKNLTFVKKFVETKGMGDILSFYYGKFYKSEAYRRWTECRKMQSRKVIHGQRIFKGGKLQELLSRLLPHFSEVKQNELLEVCRVFGEDKLSFEEFVFALKHIVGTNMLIEAVGVGKKHDLTGLAVEPAKPARAVALRPELPTGKAWSSLPCGEIINVLTGDFRLSKARSNDLFWEAVWPRLLARGWHSEEPKDHGVSTLKHTLVFLVPGVKKFSRRKLVKGEHYFDSVSDVLNKVAADPSLLELGTDATEEKKYDEPKPRGDSLRKWKPQRYLQPRVSNSHLNSVKFMIVDTSLSHNGEGSKIRVMKRLPVDTTNVSSSSDVSTETELEHLSRKPKDEAEETESTKYSVEASARTRNVGSSDYLANGSVPSLTDIDNVEVQETNSFNQKRQENIMKDKARKKVKSSYSNELPFINRCATALRDESSSQSAAFSGKQSSVKNSLGKSSYSVAGNMVLHVDTSLNISSASSSTKGSPVEKKTVPYEGHGDGAMHPGNTYLQTLFDLNLPRATPDLEANVVMGQVDSHNDSSAAGASFMTEASQQPQTHLQQVESSDAGANGGHQLQSHEKLPHQAEFSGAGISTEHQQPNMLTSSSARRQSTRSRPLTTKALEALECGFLDTKKKRKREDALPQYKSRSSRRSHRSDEMTSLKEVSYFVRNEDSLIQQEGPVGTFRSNSNMVETSSV